MRRRLRKPRKRAVGKAVAMGTREAVPPPGPGMIEEATRTGRWPFRWRSYLPLVVLAWVLTTTARSPIPTGGPGAIPWWSATGIGLGLLGYLFRAWTVGHVPPGTSLRGTSEPGAASLNTRGTYSVVRHPLYFGNFLMWTGVALVTGHVGTVLVVALAFWPYYERIMIAEERFLYERFGETFKAWCEDTPAFWPRLGHWTAPELPFSWRFALGRDYQALFALVAATTGLEVVRRTALGQPWLPSPIWQWYFGAGTLFYLVVHRMKRRTHLLERSSRVPVARHPRRPTASETVNRP